jgi:hypothetical protein
MGRPSLRTPEIEDEIVARLSDGEPLRQICRDDHMPHWTTAYDWIDEGGDFSLRIARARARGFDAIAEESLEIIDTEPREATTQFGSHVDSAHVTWLKNRAEHRLKLLAKWDPKRYGEKVTQEISGPDGGPIRVIGEMSDAELEAIAAAGSARAADPQAGKG